MFLTQFASITTIICFISLFASAATTTNEGNKRSPADSSISCRSALENALKSIHKKIESKIHNTYFTPVGNEGLFEVTVFMSTSVKGSEVSSSAYYLASLTCKPRISTISSDLGTMDLLTSDENPSVENPVMLKFISKSYK